jgi:hypothetical protein
VTQACPARGTTWLTRTGPPTALAARPGPCPEPTAPERATLARTGWRITLDRVTGLDGFRLTQYARGGGCACKIPPGELEETLGAWTRSLDVSDRQKIVEVGMAGHRRMQTGGGAG